MNPSEHPVATDGGTKTVVGTETNASHTSTSCPECHGQIATMGTERVCEDCGLVVDEDRLDRGPEWNAFTAQEREERSRVGALRTERRHDRGLGTQIGHPSETKGDRLHRARRYHKQAKYSSKKDRNRGKGLGEVHRLADTIGLSGDLVDRACRLFREAHDEGLAQGRSIEAVAAAAVLAMGRERELPVTADGLCSITSVTESVLCDLLFRIARTTSAEVRPSAAVQHIDRIASELVLDDTIRRRAREVARELQQRPLCSGVSPGGAAAGIIEALGTWYDDHAKTWTQAELADKAGVTAHTLRTNRDRFLDAGILDEVGIDGGKPA